MARTRKRNFYIKINFFISSSHNGNCRLGNSLIQFLVLMQALLRRKIRSTTLK